jgi:hypothetical protein
VYIVLFCGHVHLFVSALAKLSTQVRWCYNNLRGSRWEGVWKSVNGNNFGILTVTISNRGVGSIKRLGGGGAPASRVTLGYRKGHLFFKKSWKFPNKKGTFQTFDVNLVFTVTLACTKRALFITKKGTFSPLKKLGGHMPPCPPPGSYATDK